MNPTPRRSVLELLGLAAEYLGKKGVEAPRRDADALLAHVLECDRLHLYLRFEEAPTPKEVDLFRALMVRRGEREPLQYLTGTVRFDGLQLACDRRALIPRPETEDLLRLVAGLGGGVQGWRCADIGTGTGCLALALAARGAEVLATDISADALALAGENARALGLTERVRLGKGDLLAPLEGEGAFDLIVSNPPYIALGERSALAPEVAAWEPETALFAGAQGLDLLVPLLDRARSHLKPGGWLAMECGKGQAAGLAVRALDAGWGTAETRRDGFDVERFVVCRNGS
jgi:release factor glutamine methyltransferase